VAVRNEYARVIEDIEFNREMINSDDEEMRDFAKHELPGLQQKKGTA